jgi:hypothetical protein
MTDFRSLLDTEVTEVERPKPLVAGNYVWNVAEYKFDKSAKKKTDFVQFKLVPVMAQEDVDPAELALVLGDKSLSDFSKNVDFYLTKDAVWRLDEFLLEKLACEPGQSRTAMIESAIGRQVVGQISLTPSERDENVMYANLTAFAKYDG